MQNTIIQLEKAQDFLNEHARGGCQEDTAQLGEAIDKLKATQQQTFATFQEFHFNAIQTEDPLFCEASKIYCVTLQYLEQA